MKVRPLFFSIFALAPAIGHASSSCEAATAWPTFCAIPRVPADRLTPQAIHAVVLGTRMSGQSLEQATAPGTFTLENTEGYAERARQEAAAPPPMTTPSEDTAAFERKARAAVAPPPRHH